MPGRKPHASSNATPRPKPPPSVSLRAAAALFIERQHLDRPRARRLTAASLSRFAESTGGIQLDSINVLERAHYLTVWSRFGAYDRAAFDRLAYRRRVLFEYWAHAACLVPVAHLPAWRRVMLDYRPRQTGWRDWLRKNPKVLAAVEEGIRESGPLGNADFRHRRPSGASGWWNWKPATHAFHFLWMSGRLLVDSRRHFQKRFDLAERVFPALASMEPPSIDQFLRWHIERSLHAMGAATELDLRLYLTFPHVKPGLRKGMLATMLEDGTVVEVSIEGDRARWFALARDLPALEKAARRRSAARGTTMLAPFDSFLWHRERTHKLFGFNYRIEVYTPGHKRVHGYYSLPIFHDGQIIGRLDAKNHRAEARLEVRHVHFEPWFASGAAPPAASWGAIDRDHAFAGLTASLGSLATFLGARRVTLARVTPTRLAPPLRRALRDLDAAREAAPHAFAETD